MLAFQFLQTCYLSCEVLTLRRNLTDYKHSSQKSLWEVVPSCRQFCTGSPPPLPLDRTGPVKSWRNTPATCSSLFLLSLASLGISTSSCVQSIFWCARNSNKDFRWEIHNIVQGSQQIQCNVYQITNGIFHRTTTKSFKIRMETQRPQIARAILRKKNR